MMHIKKKKKMKTSSALAKKYLKITDVLIIKEIKIEYFLQLKKLNAILKGSVPFNQMEVFQSSNNKDW